VSRSYALLVAVLSLTGCGGAASNGEWVREPEGGGSLGDAPISLERDPSLDTQSDAAPKNGPKRLDHTVTLGSVFEAPPDPAAPGAPAPASITINVNNYSGGYGTPYYGYGYAAYAGSGFRPSAPGGGFPSHPSQGSGSSTVQPGQSWPAAPSYGPAFPYHTSPASPWETRR
jgi:hypothetical protein